MTLKLIRVIPKIMPVTASEIGSNAGREKLVRAIALLRKKLSANATDTTLSSRVPTLSHARRSRLVNRANRHKCIEASSMSRGASDKDPMEIKRKRAEITAAVGFQN